MMKTIMAARSPQESSFSFSRRHFQKIIEKVVNKEHGEREEEEEAEEEYLKRLTSDAGADDSCHKKKEKATTRTDHVPSSVPKLIKSALAAAIVGRTLRQRPRSLVCGTLFGYRRGHVHLAFQPDPKSAPTLLIQLAMPTATLVREMASGLVRIALERDRPSAAAAAMEKKKKKKKKKSQRLVEEEMEWRAYCNGKKCGLARNCGAEEASWVLRAVEAVTMGAGVLPGGPHGQGARQHDLGEMMYMRARFERVVGSRDSEAFYMLNPPDGNYSAPELSLYLLTV